jgi:hypothetical protein
MTSSRQSTNAIRWLYEALFSLNLGFAVSFGFLTYADLPLNPHRAPFDSIAFAIDRWFRSHARTTGLGVAFVYEAIGIAFIVFLPLIVLHFAPEVVGRVLLGPLACLSALSSAPIFWMLAMSYAGPYIGPFDITPAWWILVCETTLMMAALCLTLFRHKPLVYSLALLVAHYGLWAYYMWPTLADRWYFTPRIVAVSSIAAGVSWVLYARNSRRECMNAVLPLN